MSKRRIAVWFALAVSLLVFTAAGAAFYSHNWFQRPGPLAVTSTLVIPRGAGLEAIASQLHAAGVIDNSFVFRLGVRSLYRERVLKAGEYTFPAEVSMDGAATILASGKTVVRRVTLPEGLSSVEVVAALTVAQGLDGAIETIPPDGTLLPETYHYVYGDKRRDLLRRMEASLDKVLAALWPKRAPNLPFTTPDEAVILASIVEKETGVAAERPLIAGVFVNRLQKGMRLQSDPTVVYGLTQGRSALGRALTRKDVEAPSAYNTYIINGLPPGPIANPGRAAIEAVLNPAQTDYLYFVADGSGGHAFAKTLAQHNRNVAKWRKFRREKKKLKK